MQAIHTLNCKGRLLSFGKPIVMGIVNVTPDSFYNQGKDSSLKEILLNVEKMLNQGATIIDVGGMSTKPNADNITTDTELSRVVPVIENIKKNFPDCFLSIDTYRSIVSEQSVLAGADIINDISAGEEDDKIIDICVKYRVPYIAMHKQGTPQTMQLNPHYENVTLEIFDYLSKKIHGFKSKNLHDVIIDVGFGFGKTVAHNFQLLHQLSIFKQIRKPLLVGISRKSMICKPLQVNPPNALNGTTALHSFALQNGADILRVHDVKEAMECIKIYEYYYQFNSIKV